MRRRTAAPDRPGREGAGRQKAPESGGPAVTLTPGQLRQVQLTELELLSEAHRICRKCGIPYVMIAGTLLGSVRHGGFIPWDDDADIALFRKDYERFAEACRTELDHTRFEFQDDVRTPGYRWGYGKLRRKDTLFLRAGQEHMPYFQGIFLDVFPLDAVPAGRAGRRLWDLGCLAVRKLLWARAGKVSADSGLLRSWYRLMDRIPEKKALAAYHRLIARSERLGDTGWVRILMFPTPNAACGYRRDWYRRRAVREFEGRRFFGIRDADAYLRFKYGAYRELPPPGERKTHPVSRLRLPADAVPAGCEDLVRALYSGPAYVFGTGYVAGVLNTALQKAGLTDRIAGYVRTAPENGTYRGKPVLSLREYKRLPQRLRGPLIAAVHEAVAETLLPAWEREGLTALPAAPYLPELLYGEPLERNIRLRTADILKRQPPGQYWIAVRFAALTAIKSGETAGKTAYCRALGLFCSPETAAARLERFERLAADIEENGFDPERPILLDEDGRVIDGLHRIAAAALFGEEELHCRIFARSALYDRVLDARNFLTEEQLGSAGFTQEELRVLKEAQERLEHTGDTCR